MLKGLTAMMGRYGNWWICDDIMMRRRLGNSFERQVERVQLADEAYSAEIIGKTFLRVKNEDRVLCAFRARKGVLKIFCVHKNSISLR